MAFHVEISAGYQHARVFNLNREDVEAKIVGPWLEDRIIEMGDHEWEPRESRLTILEGPHMETTDLSFGQGWANAERASENVTRGLLQSAPPPRTPDAFLVETESPESVTADLVAGHDGRAIHWGEARQRLDGRDPEIAAVILVVRRPAGRRRRSKVERDAAGDDQHRVGGGLDRVVAGGAEDDLALGRLGPGTDHEQVDRTAAVLGDAGAERGREAVGGLRGRLASPSSMTPTVLTLTDGLVWSPAGATAIADGPPSSNL